jgi:hypothetical protein
MCKYANIEMVNLCGRFDSAKSGRILSEADGSLNPRGVSRLERVYAVSIRPVPAMAYAYVRVSVRTHVHVRGCVCMRVYTCEQSTVNSDGTRNIVTRHFRC